MKKRWSVSIAHSPLSSCTTGGLIAPRVREVVNDSRIFVFSLWYESRSRPR